MQTLAPHPGPEAWGPTSSVRAAAAARTLAPRVLMFAAGPEPEAEAIDICNSAL